MKSMFLFEFKNNPEFLKVAQNNCEDMLEGIKSIKVYNKMFNI